MDKKRDFAIKWLQQAVKFSEEPNGKIYNWLRTNTIKFRVLIDVRNLDIFSSGQDWESCRADYFNLVAEDVKELLGPLVEGSGTSFKKARYETLYQLRKGGGQEGFLINIIDDPTDNNLSGISVFMLHIMTFYDIHVLGRCEACGEILFATKKTRKKTCNAACRQKLFRKKMDPEKKAQVHKRRVERYHQNKGGDHGSKCKREG